MKLITPEEHISLFYNFLQQNESVRLFISSLNQIYLAQGCMLDDKMCPRTNESWIEQLDDDALAEIMAAVRKTDISRPLYAHDFHGAFNYLIYVLPSRKGIIGYLLVRYDHQSLINKIFDFDRLIKPVYDEILNYFDCLNPHLEPLSLGQVMHRNST
jgi:hypothetical protein